MEFIFLPEFEKDLKKLKKKYKTLPDDLAVLEKVLSVSAEPQPPQRVQISSLGIESPVIVKVKHFTCRSLKGKGARSGIRIIYAYLQAEQRVEFVEMYFKYRKHVMKSENYDYSPARRRSSTSLFGGS
jgi:mRNA-degrading endonuclease RelE of RelBE toxin-antitoxin system